MKLSILNCHFVLAFRSRPLRRSQFSIRKAVGLLLFAAVSAVWAQPRPEYPRPQFERQDWVNLNGQWSYTFDFVGSGVERRFYESKGFDGNITVPFAPESKLSGVEYTDFINNIC